MSKKNKDTYHGSIEWKLAEALSTLHGITKWSFVLDGRKFKGNHKEVLRHVITESKLALKALGVKL